MNRLFLRHIVNIFVLKLFLALVKQKQRRRRKNNLVRFLQRTSVKILHAFHKVFLKISVVQIFAQAKIISSLKRRLDKFIVAVKVKTHIIILPVFNLIQKLGRIILLLSILGGISQNQFPLCARERNIAKTALVKKLMLSFILAPRVDTD